MNKANLLKRIILCILSVVILLNMVAVPAFAEETTADPQQVLALIEKLPVDSKLVTIENKDDILAAKVAYDSITVEQRIEVSTDKVAILNSAFSALVPLMLVDLVASIKELPETKKLSDKDTETVLALYNDYALLPEDAKAAFSSEHKDTLIAAVKKLAPDSLSDADAPKDEEAKNENSEETKAKIDFNTIWQTALMILASLIVLLTLTALIILIVKIFLIRCGNKVE